MSFRDQVRREITAKVDDLAADARALHPAWITHDICVGHLVGLGDGDDADFWRQAGYIAVRAEVGQYLRKYYSADKSPDDEDGQRRLPGFEYVQTHYIVERDGDELAIPTTDLNDDEIARITARLRATGSALFAHADDLERFQRSRTAPPLFSDETMGMVAAQ